MTTRSSPNWLHLGLLLIWCGLGLGLRLLHLELKPLWTDEFATIVFSLGHSFRTIPLNQLLTPEQLLQPLQVLPKAGPGDVVEHLMAESTHPPLYFLLAHAWMQLFPQSGWVSVWAVRSLSALLGAMSVPAMFGLSWLAFRSRLIAHLSALVIAVSPYSIYLAQEARHYTLVILWVIASLACWVLALQARYTQKPLPLWLAAVWIAVNACGMATHYFFVLTLLAEAIVLLGFWLSDLKQGKPATLNIPNPKFWWRMVAIAAGTAVGVLVWVPAWLSVYGNELTHWIYAEGRSGWGWFDPVIQAIAGWITMLVFFPIQAPLGWLAITSGIAMIFVTVWAGWVLYRGGRLQWQTSLSSRPMLLSFSGFVLAAIALFFTIAYGLSTDVTSAFRFNFVFFPAVVLLIAASLASFWIGDSSRSLLPVASQRFRVLANGKSAVIVFGLVGLLSALTVAGGWGYQKTHRPDLVVQDLRKVPPAPTLVAIAHATHGQTGRLMGIAWELKRQPLPSDQPWFLLAHQTADPLSAARTLPPVLQSLPRPLNLWLVNFPNPADLADFAALLNSQNCQVDPNRKDRTDGYRYRLYRCLPGDLVRREF